MKFFTMFAIGGYIASALASPIVAANDVAKRQDDSSLVDQKNTLLSSIQAQTAIINNTMASVPSDPTDDQLTASAASIAPQLQAITALLTSANTTVAGQAPTSKRSPKGFPAPPPDLIKVVGSILYELLFTTKVILFKLGLGKVVLYLTPLVLAVKGLVFSLDFVVPGLLISVGPIVNQLLTAVGLSLIAL
ncbi:hypothetical protein F5Y16DRAFT_402143 [Xylariaceae sp. FL0255]|nr:hypothetical protein F5Y16DRAFT_402143 [Xylariaceae sp. FL0255]